MPKVVAVPPIAVSNVNGIIASAISGWDARDQEKVEALSHPPLAIP